MTKPREFWVHSQQPIIQTKPWTCPEGEVIHVIEAKSNSIQLTREELRKAVIAGYQAWLDDDSRYSDESLVDDIEAELFGPESEET